MCNVYRRFFPDYSDIAAPLNALLQEGQPVKLDPFGAAEDESFRALIDAVKSPPVLALPRPDLPYSVDTDASDYQVGAVLFQTTEDGERRPIGYWSRSLKPAEKNYSTPEKECLAVVWALTTLRPYLQGEQFTLYSDQASLRWLITIAEPSGRLMRWRLRLSEFNFTIQYKRGVQNTQADALSRLATLGETTSDLDDEIPCFMVEEDSIVYNDDMDFISNEYAEFDEMLITENAEPPADLLTPISVEELLRAQAEDTFCQ